MTATRRIDDGVSEPLYATSYMARREGTDAAGDSRTAYTIAVGDTFSGNLSTASDTDWVRVTLQPGAYGVGLIGAGTRALSDPYLRIYDASGTQIGVNDDLSYPDILDSGVQFRVTQPGTFFISAGSYAASHSGTYSLGIVSIPTFTNRQIANQLTDGYWNDQGLSRRAFDVSPGQSLNVDLSGLDADGRRLAVSALSAWTDVSGIRFNIVTPGGGRPVHIRFDDAESGAWSSSSVFGADIASSTVNIARSWLDENGTGFHTYSYQTYIHEIGHALGLGHAGNYNSSADFGLDNHYANDSWQSSVMSYFSQSENTTVMASEAYVVSAMVADIIAIQDLYGRVSLRTGNTVYGEGSNAGGNYGRISNMLATGARDDITFAILDSGGIDLLNLSGDTHNQRIDLAAGGISSAYGLTGNILIATDTVIENFRAGAGNDVVRGNAAHNSIMGNGGSDRLIGLAGNDTLNGGAGRDTLEGGAGNDTYRTDGRDRLIEAAGAGVDTVLSSASATLAANFENLQLTGNALNGVGNAAANRITGNALNNTLNGLGGADILRGGAGNDRLIGGGQADSFVFDRGRDIVADFQNNIDTLQIDDAAWGGAARSTAQVLNMARVVNGDIVFNFGNGNTLTIDNYASIASLSDDLVII